MNFDTEIFSQFHKKWALVSAGSLEDHNAMTVSWGEMGTLWSIPVITVYVKPCRYTYEFMENNDYFTVSFYDEEYRDALNIMGTLSGKDTDKEKQANLTPVQVGESVSFKEAKKTFLCKKIYYQDLDVSRIPDNIVQRHYTVEKPHRMYVGEVIDVIKKRI